VKIRQIGYTVALNHTLGPKSCSVTEKQVSILENKPQKCIFANFLSKNRIDLRPVQQNGPRVRCKVRVSKRGHTLRRVVLRGDHLLSDPDFGQPVPPDGPRRRGVPLKVLGHCQE